jgi:hypothetical protein
MLGPRIWFLAALLALMTEGVHEMLGPTHTGW